MKVLIINPGRIFSDSLQKGKLEHLFVLFSYLRRHCPGVEVDVLDLDFELSGPECEKGVQGYVRLARLALQATDFDIVGISCWSTYQYLGTVAVANLCKELNPECTVVVGGYHPSVLPDDFAYPDTPFDYVVRGEGEVVFKQIVCGELPAEARPHVVTGSAVDFAQEVLEWGEYKYHRNSDRVGMWLSRGCPFSCSYCFDRQTRWRGYDPKQAVAEVKRVVREYPRLKMIDLFDPIFGLNKPWRREFLDLLLEADLGIGFWCETRVDILEEEDLKKMGALNFQVDIGLESVSPRMLSIMMKTKHPDQYLEAFARTDEWMNRYGICHHIYQLLNYPGETSATLDEHMAYWTRYYDEHPDTHGLYSAWAYAFFPGGEVFSNWPAYEAKYGARVLQPKWWKMALSPHYELARQIVPTTELAEAGKLSYYKQIKGVIEQMATASIHRKVKDSFIEWNPARSLLADTDRGFYDGKYLRLGQSAYLHQRLSTQKCLYNFDRNDGHICTGEEERWLDELLKPTPANELIDRQVAQHPEPLKARRKIEKFLGNMLVRQFLQLDAGRPTEPLDPDKSYAAVIRTNLGTMAFELLAQEAPATVANFVHHVRAGYYNRMQVGTAFPGAFIETGILLANDRTPGEPLPEEHTDRRHERGSLSMAIAVHTARFTICRVPWPDFDGTRTVFSRLVSGWDVLDGLVKVDILEAIDIVEMPVPAVAIANVAAGF